MPALAIAQALRRARAGRRAGAGRRGARRRGAPAPDPRFPLPPAAVRADLPPHLVEERALAAHRGPAAAARSAECSRTERPVAVLGTGGYASGAGGLVGRAARHPDRDPGAERLSRARHPAAEPAGPPRLPRPARGAALLRFGRADRGVRHRQSDRPAHARAAGAALARFGLDGTRPVVLVTGGSQGALAINRAVAGWLDAGGPGGRRPALGDRPRHPRGVRRLATGRPASRSSTFSTRWPTATPWPTSSSRGRA